MPEVVAARPREGKFNKNAARRLRAAGKIPAVLYGPGHAPVAIEVEPKQISRILFPKKAPDSEHSRKRARQARKIARKAQLQGTSFPFLTKRVP